MGCFAPRLYFRILNLLPWVLLLFHWIFSARIFYRDIPSSANDCSCCVWYQKLSTSICMLVPFSKYIFMRQLVCTFGILFNKILLFLFILVRDIHISSGYLFFWCINIVFAICLYSLLRYYFNFIKHLCTPFSIDVILTFSNSQDFLCLSH